MTTWEKDLADNYAKMTNDLVKLRKELVDIHQELDLRREQRTEMRLERAAEKEALRAIKANLFMWTI